MERERERKLKNLKVVEESVEEKKKKNDGRRGDENEKKRISRSTNVDLQHSFVLNPLSLITTD